MKINQADNKFYWLYLAGFFVILALPIFIIPPYFFPADWGKSIVFKSIMAILLFLFVFQLLFKKNELKIPNFKKNTIFWLLAGLLFIFLLATIFSVDPLFSLWGNPYRGGGFVTFAFCIIFSVLAFTLLKNNIWKKTWLFSIIIGLLVSLTAVIQYYGLFNKIFMAEPGRPSSTMGNPELLATYLLLLLFCTLSSAIKEKNRYLKIFYIFSLLTFLYTILITGSRAAYLGTAIGALYFFLLYPKKMMVIKIAIIGLVILTVGFVVYINIANQYPKFLQQNKLFNSVASRLSIRLLLTDPRFYAWAGIDYKILLEKPILGYGPENFAVGFDKYYDPSIPYLNESWGDWWDRAHNILIQTGSDAGFLGIIAYLALFVVLFYQLHKTKHKNLQEGEQENTQIIAHCIQATLIGYFITNLFSFDSFSTYLIFFLLVGYSMHIIYSNAPEEVKTQTQKKAWLKSACICVLFVILMIFLWQYNFVPLQINAEINNANDLVNQKQCNRALSLMDNSLLEHSFLDSYIRMEYVEFEQTCGGFYPENNLTYTKKGINIISDAVKIQPLYTRYWIWLGTLTTTLADQQDNSAARDNLIKQAGYYFNKASQLSPKRQEILVGQAKMEIVAENYAEAQNYSEKCLALNSGLGDCYWYLALSEIYLKNSNGADKNMQIAVKDGYRADSETSLVELGNAYGHISDYQNLATVFEKLIAIEPNVAQYHTYLASFYMKLGEYDKAKQEELKASQLSSSPQ